MITAILVDDESSNSDLLAWQLEQFCPEVELVAICNSSKEALKEILELKPDLVFLDIEMPGMSGFDLLQKIKTIDFNIIFVTAHDQFALKAFKFSAVDYLLKPIDPQDLRNAVDKVMQVVNKNKQKLDLTFEDRFNLLLTQIEQLKNHQKVKKIALSTAEGLIFIDVDDIICCESDRNYTTIYFVDGKKTIIAKNIGVIEEILSLDDFLRIHQSYLVNLNHVKKYVRDNGGYVLLTNEMHIAISKGKKDDFLNRFSKI